MDSSARFFIGLLTLLVGALVQATDLTISAAASLTDAFRDVARSLEEQHPNLKVRLNFAASGTLLQQIARGAPVDLFATADEATLERAEQQQLLVANSGKIFAHNSLVLAVPANSELPLNDISGLANPAVLRIALGNSTYVPAGRYGKQALETADLWHAVSDRIIPTQNVRQALDYVARNEVEAAFVYATDARVMSDKLSVFAVPLDEPISYPIAIVKGTANMDEAELFIRYLLSSPGRAILARHGFRQAAP